MGKPLGITPAGGGSGFGVSYSAGIGWLKSFRETGSAARGQMGGHRPKTISGEHQDWLVQRCRERDFTLRRLVGEPAERGGGLSFGIGVRPCRKAVVQKRTLIVDEQDRPDVARRAPVDEDRRCTIVLQRYSAWNDIYSIRS